jgi:hypothetical protein
MNKSLKISKNLPAPSKYETFAVGDKMKFNRSSQADLNRHKGERAAKWKKTDGPSPHHYHDGKRDHYNK